MLLLIVRLRCCELVAPSLRRRRAIATLAAKDLGVPPKSPEPIRAFGLRKFCWELIDPYPIRTQRRGKLRFVLNRNVAISIHTQRDCILSLVPRLHLQ